MPSMRRIAVVTTSRADYGIYRPVLNDLSKRSNVSLGLFVTGTHLLMEHGCTEAEIYSDGYMIAQRFPALVSGDCPRAIVKSIGLATMAFSDAIENWPPDILVVLGDRFEMHAAAVAAQPFNIPVAHIHGGEVTYGSMDDAFRHSMSKMSHLHFPATKEAGKRLLQMGESEWRIMVSGAPGLDSVIGAQPLDENDFLFQFGVPLNKNLLVVTYHPPTRYPDICENECRALVCALSKYKGTILITGPNADPKGSVVRSILNDFADKMENVYIKPSLGVEGYATVLREAVAIIGNSSSGLIEAPSFGLPVVNIGRRQDGRLRAANVIDVPDPKPETLTKALNQAVSPLFRSSLSGLPNPYGDGSAGPRIGLRLSEVPLDGRLLRKEFNEVSFSCPFDS